MSFKYTALLYCAAALMPLATSAQQRNTAPNPTDPVVAVPAMQYESVFTAYFPFRDEKLSSWREANEEAARVGGHIGIFGGSGAHAGHNLAKPASPAPASAKKQAIPTMPPMTHQGGQEGKKK